jgi:hypothetical protein
MRNSFLPYCLLVIGEEEISEVTDSLRSGWVTTGPKVNLNACHSKLSAANPSSRPAGSTCAVKSRPMRLRGVLGQRRK